MILGKFFLLKNTTEGSNLPWMFLTAVKNNINFNWPIINLLISIYSISTSSKHPVRIQDYSFWSDPVYGDQQYSNYFAIQISESFLLHFSSLLNILIPTRALYILLRISGHQIICRNKIREKDLLFCHITRSLESRPHWRGSDPLHFLLTLHCSLL